MPELDTRQVVLDVAVGADRPPDWQPDELFASIATLVADHGGRDGQVFADQASYVFPLTHAAGALSTGIHLQHAQQQPGAVGVTIGIALGPVPGVTAGHGGRGGPAARTARYLAGLANVGAILVDLDTVAAANLHAVSVPALADRAACSFGSIAQGHLPGRHRPFEFVELVWDVHPRGLNPSALNPVLHWPDPPAGDPADGTDSSSRWLPGVVRSWNREREHGFIVAGEEFFYFDDRFVADPALPAVGTAVVFQARPALIEGKNRVAALVLRSPAPDGDARGVVSDKAGNRAPSPRVPT
jgi:hypothetical protein